jgi:LysM repeat protein
MLNNLTKTLLLISLISSATANSSFNLNTFQSVFSSTNIKQKQISEVLEKEQSNSEIKSIYLNELNKLYSHYAEKVQSFKNFDKISSNHVSEINSLLSQFEQELFILNDFYNSAPNNLKITETKEKISLFKKLVDNFKLNAVDNFYYSKSYIVLKGDTLFSIAKKSNLDFETFSNEYQKTNNKANFDLKVGDIISIPSSVKESKMTKYIIEKSSNHSLKKNTHLVKKGDTLFKLSKVYNTSIEHLVQDNNIQDNNLILGRVLKIRKNLYIDNNIKIEPIAFKKQKSLKSLFKDVLVETDSNFEKNKIIKPTGNLKEKISKVNIKKFNTKSSTVRENKSSNLDFFDKPTDLNLTVGQLKKYIINHLTSNLIKLSEAKANEIYDTISENAKFWNKDTWKYNTLISISKMQTETSFREFTRKNNREYSEGALQIELKTAKYIVKKSQRLSLKDDNYKFIKDYFSNKNEQELMTLLKDTKYNVFFSFAYQDILEKRFDRLYKTKINQSRYIQHVDKFINKKIKDKNSNKYINISENLKDISKYNYPLISMHNGGIKNDKYVADVLAVATNIMNYTPNNNFTSSLKSTK